MADIFLPFPSLPYIAAASSSWLSSITVALLRLVRRFRPPFAPLAGDGVSSGLCEGRRFWARVGS
ncbi:hypothetical protein CMQ_8312 [Grosmannia clavigera kw1407]|uniref:Uncharacterized protein n=1 Tax=Grosmannia clavigera (strain kw1407 / UAMH 11150) TaxID=655863 RepID=F0XRL7_GROCL|nr:uncharacterized protein CMQ_8312 [Grosmannia clavigera kw1407]EFW99673.1 hypothetical protein CMQ_8312 [Grosmannia clavigera kw1407]